MRIDCEKFLAAAVITGALSGCFIERAPHRHQPPTAQQHGAPASAEAVVNETSWSVNGHPVPWVFHPNGTLEAPGLWRGTWVFRAPGQYDVSMNYTVPDAFVVQFSPDGRSFVAYKNGGVYRNGTRR